MSQPPQVEPGSRVLARNAWGDWIPKVAVSAVEYGHNFLVVWVEPVEGGGGPVPWPAEHVKLADPEPGS